MGAAGMMRSVWGCQRVCVSVRRCRINWMGMSRRTGDTSAAGAVGRTPITATHSSKLDGRLKTETPLHYPCKPSCRVVCVWECVCVSESVRVRVYASVCVCARESVCVRV